MYLGGAAGAIWGVLYPGVWAILYQAPIAFAVTDLVLMTDARAELESRTALTVAAWRSFDLHFRPGRCR